LDFQVKSHNINQLNSLEASIFVTLKAPKGLKTVVFHCGFPAFAHKITGKGNLSL